MATHLQLRRDTAANWALGNPVLADGEEGYERDTGKRKVGDGATAWNALPYVSLSGTVSFSYADLPAGTTITVQKDPSTGWPARPTARADIFIAWKGPDPSPPIVASGTAGMLDGVDYRLVTPS
jgi:hypothetical protein